MIITVVLVLVIAGTILGLAFTRGRSKRLQGQFGTEYEHTVQATGSEEKAQTVLEGRQKHVKTLDRGDPPSNSLNERTTCYYYG